MDADGRKKRKASAVATLRKRPRRDKSEFVSVEAGMRAFRKRLASGAAAGETKTELEDLTQDVKGVRTRAKKTTPRKPTAVKKTEAAIKKEPVKKTTVKKKTTAAGKKTTVAAGKKTPVKRQRKTTAKLTLAEVKEQLEREQKERVESRIQTLHRDATPSTSETVAAGVESTLSTAASAPTTITAVDTLTSRNGSVVNSAAQQVQDVEPVVEAPVVPSFVQQAPPGRVDAQVIAPSAIPAAHAAIVADTVVAAGSPPNAGKNEFIADDLDEDFMFAMALEEVERKLATPQKAPIAIEPTATADSNTLVSASFHGPTVSPAPAKVPPEAQTPPSQTVETTPQQLPEAATKVKQEAPAVQMAPELLEEMERLRKENELLRRSNELLQAAVTSPTHREAPVEEKFDHAHEHLDNYNGKKDRGSPAVTSSDSATASSAARYLDLGRCDSDHEMDQITKTSDGDQECTMERSSENHNGHDQFSENVQVDEFAGNFGRVRDQQLPDEGNSHPAEPNILVEGSPELSSAVEAQEKTTATSLSTPPASTCSDDDYSSQRQDPVQEDKNASPVLVNPIEPEVEISTRSTTRSNEGAVSDASMSEVEEEENDMEEDDGEKTIEDKDLTSRTATIDSGNYTKYKEDDLEDADDEEMKDTHGSKIVRSLDTVERASPATASTDTKTIKMVIESDADQEPGTPVNSDIIGRTTAPSNSDEDEDEDEVVTTVKRRGRRAVIASSSSSSSSSESESESDEEDKDDTRSTNVLEAALRAAGGESDCINPPKALSTTASAAVSDKKPVPSVAASSPPLGAKTTSKKRKIPGLTSSNKRPPSVKSSLLWPALDEFYDFILDLTPRNVRGSEKKREHLQQYAGGKLPVQHSSIEDYCDVQLEAIMEELVASVSDSTDRRGSGRSGPIRHLSLTSVSPCGVQASTPSLGLSFGAIFSESGFTGSTSSNNDYILTFDASVLGKKGSLDFMSGDLVLVSSPRWKNYEMCVFGVVLCDSVVAVGGKSNGTSGNNGGGGTDQICVLIRAQMRDQGDAVENFNVLTELCLSNQRAANWKWSLQQVHNTTTSAREFQAIKAISFLPNDLKQVLLRGKLVPTSKTEQTSKKLSSSTSILSPRLLKYLHKHYNDSQMHAIVGCLGEDSRVIIQGPPGTGKTKTILGLLSALLDGAGLSTLQKAKGTARIRVGASLQSARTSAVSKTVAETSIRILVAAPSNAAVDELVVRVLSEGLFDGEKGESYRPRIVRVGRPESNQQQSGLAAAREASESKKTRKKMRKYAREVEEVLLESLVTKHRSSFPTIKQTRQAIIKNAQIVFCTLSGAGSVAMCEFAHDFDALIIDEAAQAVEASTLIPFKFRPHRVVLVGDHRQLPATVISKKLVSMGYDRSLQQRLVENGSPVRLLTKQYRMHPEIAEFPSSYFYEGRLVQDANMREWTAQDYHRDRAFKPLLFLDVQGAQSQVSGSTSLRNLSEVEVVVQLIRRLLKKFPNIEWRKRIGVIAPYKQQIFEVRGALGRLESEYDRSLGIEVNTVDGFQGREKEIIIYSCVRTSHGGRRKKKRRSHGDNKEEDDVLDAFWADERRMNVAITRAKSSLWIVGNSTLLQQSRAWRALIQHTKDHDRYVSDAAAILLAAGTRKANKTRK